MNIKEAATLWVQRDMWAIPYSVAEKLQKFSEYTDFEDITPISTDDKVWSNTEQGVGYVTDIFTNEDGEETIIVDFGDEKIECNRYDLSREEFGDLPMWGCLWAFNDGLDKDWIEKEENLIKMAELGFKIYDSEDYGYVFGIDGAGYDFYEAHWIPLYKARGLRWHDEY